MTALYLPSGGYVTCDELMAMERNHFNAEIQTPENHMSIANMKAVKCPSHL
jgi:hypothetical protein